MTLQTRKPTGLPSWPIMLIAGVEKSGKSYACAEASASELIGRTLWVGVGEDDPDELGALPGARFEIVEHDGTYRGILAALTDCANEPPTGGKRKADVLPNLIVLDSATKLWDLLCDEQQVTANDRAKRKAERSKRPLPDEDATITMDQWNTAKQRWGHIIDTLRAHQGPSIVTARLEDIVVVEGGQPTKGRAWKVKAEKSLPFDVGCIVELHALGDSYLTGVRSLRYKPGDAERSEYKPFTVDRLWRDLGLADGAGERRHAHTDPEDKPAADADAARAELLQLCTDNGWNPKDIAEDWAAISDCQLRDSTNAAAIRTFAEELAKRAKEKAA